MGCVAGRLRLAVLARGMHTVDLHEQQRGQWIAAVDGFKHDELFIGY